MWRTSVRKQSFLFLTISASTVRKLLLLLRGFAEGQWNTGRVEGPNLGYKPRYKEGYFPVHRWTASKISVLEMVLLMKKWHLR